MIRRVKYSVSVMWCCQLPSRSVLIKSETNNNQRLVEHNLIEVDTFQSYKDLHQDINNMKIRLLKYKKMVRMN